MAQTPKLIFLVPSADTSWQDQDRVQGNTDLPLSEEGQRQATDMAIQWTAAMAGVKTIYTGPDEASRQTAAAFAQPLGAKLKKVAELVEMHLGVWQGLTESDLKERYRSTYHHWQDDPATVSVPQGEQLDAVLERLETAVLKLIGKTGADPLVLVLRPVIFELCNRWLAPWVSDTNLPGGALPGVRRFELAEPTWRNPRTLRETKRISA